MKKISQVVEKYIEKVVRRKRQLKEDAAEVKIRLMLEDLAIALESKGVKEWEGQNYTFKVLV